MDKRANSMAIRAKYRYRADPSGDRRVDRRPFDSAGRVPRTHLHTCWSLRSPSHPV